MKEHPRMIIFRKVWKYDENKVWSRRFFEDPDGYVPKPNSDVMKRRRIEGSFPHHKNDRDWSEDECELLSKIVEEERSQLRDSRRPNQNDANQNSDSSVSALDSEINFIHVCERFNAEMKTIRSRANKKLKMATHVYRSTDECRIKFINCLSPSINKSKWTKEESLRILELVHEHNGHPAWDQVATDLGTNRTPMSCLRHYQTKLNANTLKNKPFTLEEDELLLKYIAARGPQNVMAVDTCNYMCRAFFPERGHTQLLLRSQFMSANPCLKYCAWTPDEDRKLCLLMKIYKDDILDGSKVSIYFPDRAPGAVMARWRSQLDPVYDLSPLRKEETEVLASLEKVTTEEITKLFPTRRPAYMYNRWSFLMKEDLLVKKTTNALKMKGAARHVVFGTDESALLDPDDFAFKVT